MGEHKLKHALHPGHIAGLYSTPVYALKELHVASQCGQHAILPEQSVAAMLIAPEGLLAIQALGQPHLNGHVRDVHPRNYVQHEGCVTAPAKPEPHLLALNPGFVVR